MESLTVYVDGSFLIKELSLGLGSLRLRLAARGVPGDLREAAGLEVAEQDALRGGGHEEALLEDVDLLDLEADVALQHDAGTSGEALHDDLAQGDVGELVGASGVHK